MSNLILCITKADSSLHLPRPRLRDRMVSQGYRSSLESFFVPYTNGFSIGWPYEPTDCLLPVSSSSAIQLSATSSPLSTAFSNPPCRSSLMVNPPDDQPNELWRLNPVFESHVRNLANWTVGPEFVEAFPDLEDTVNVRERRTGSSL